MAVTARARKPRRKSAIDTRERILQAAAVEFSANGFAGGRLETICSTAPVNIRMIYHHFGDKEGLYVAVLEGALNQLRDEELKLDFGGFPPMEALLQFFEFTYQHFASHPQLISLLSGENLLKAKFLKRSKRTPVISSPVLMLLKKILKRGEAAGVFRKGLDALQLYVLIVSVSYFHLSNGHTLSVLFEKDVLGTRWLNEHKAVARDVVTRYVTVR